MYRSFLVFLAYCFLLATNCGDSSEPSGIGGPCGSTGDCADGLECLDALPSGSCSRGCEGDDCPEGAECVDLGGEGFCLAGCEANDDCRDGYVCSAGHCDLPCSGDEECPEWARCDEETDSCQRRWDQALGEACAASEQCASGLCLLPGAYCSDRCGGAPECEAGLFCGVASTEDEVETRCLRPIGDGAPGALCQRGDQCQSGLCSRGSCVYPCGGDSGCAGGASCERGWAEANGLGEVELDLCYAEAAAGVDLQDLGAIPTERGCAHVEFEVPEGIVSFAVVTWTEEAILLEPRNLIGPDDQHLIDSRGVGLIRVYDRDHELTVLVPNTDRTEALPRPGRYEMDICARELDGPMLLDADLRVRVLLKARDSGRCADGVMTLNLHLAPNTYGPMTADDAADSPYINQILDQLRHYYENQCHIRLGEVRYFDLASGYGVIGSEEELYEMFSNVSATAPLATANVFLVRDLGGVAEWIAGISGGLPGPPMLRGTPHSGLALATQQEGEVAGDTLAHELGHFLGLYHTTEMNGATQDTIDDTPSCSFDPENWREIMRCATIDNIMFPSLTPVMTEITEGQCFVVRGYQGV